MGVSPLDPGSKGRGSLSLNIFNSLHNRITGVLHFGQRIESYFRMITIKPKSAFLSVRLTDKTRQRFRVKASKFGKPTTVLRELIEAFIEDRLAIQAPVTRKEKMYVPRTEN